ncbi:MAG: YDG domain-containing protein, partial [Clostridia bacterium]
VVYPTWFPVDQKMTGNSNITGNFARGKYNIDGTFMSFGTRFDMATDANGNILDKSGFYAIAVGTDFVTTNTNFDLIVDKNAIKNTKLSISPAKIYMQESDLKGKNKNYDGNNIVFYNDGEAYDIAKILLRANDDVKLAFTANYSSVLAGAANSIVFSKIYLEGSASMNYVLYVGNETTGVLVNFDQTTLTITKLNNSIADATDGNLIKILKVATINIKKSDISITKEYDTTTILDKDSVRIASSSELSSIPATYKKLVGTYSYPQADVLKSFSIATLKVFFQIPNPSSSWTLPTTFDNDISLSFIDGPGESPEEGIVLIVSNMAGSITPKVIRPEKDVKSISAVNREYNATDGVEILCQLNDTAIYGNDSANGVKLTLTGKAQDPNAGEIVSGVVKKTGVDFATAVFTRPNGKAFDNYIANLADFNAYYAGANKLKAAISKVKIMPNIVIANKQ